MIKSTCRCPCDCGCDKVKDKEFNFTKSEEYCNDCRSETNSNNLILKQILR